MQVILQDQVKDFIGTADDATLTALESAIREARATRIAKRNAALPENPTLVDIAGHRVQVTRDRAIELLDQGTHTVASAEAEERRTL
jgi:hypothetical protein